MSYATPSDLQARFEATRLAELTDPTGSAVNVTVLQTALDDASVEVDGFLQGRFELPLTVIPAALVQVTCDIAMYRLFSLRPMGDIDDARHRYKDALARLTHIKNGQIDIGLSTAHLAPQTNGVGFQAQDRVFNSTVMGYGVGGFLGRVG